MAQTLQKSPTVDQKVGVQLPHDFETQLSREIKAYVHIQICLQMPIASLLVIAHQLRSVETNEAYPYIGVLTLKQKGNEEFRDAPYNKHELLVRSCCGSSQSR